MSYSWLVNIEEFDKRDYFSEDRWEVSFYCKDCQKLVKTERPESEGYTFICTECQGQNIAIGTEEWLKTNYKIK